jgi:hypothetical protein
MLPSKSGEIIVAGNGPGLNGIPDRFLLSRPLFALNVFHLHHPVVPDYWTAWDSWSLAEALPAIYPTTRVLLNERLREPFRNTQLKETPKVEWWSYLPEIKNVPRNFNSGVVVKTSLHAAVILAALMGFEQIYVVGFDCTQGPMHDNPHFYNPDKPAVYNEEWDLQMGYIAEHFKSSTQILNLSAVTQAVHIERADWTFYI